MSTVQNKNAMAYRGGIWKKEVTAEKSEGLNENSVSATWAGLTCCVMSFISRSLMY